ncbi:hypothetical protein NKH18_42230 [Streptomyces sp. M10(2022)]
MGRTDTLIEHDVPVPMRDGTVLRADVWRPAAGRPDPPCSSAPRTASPSLGWPP